jgi:hypothetical protein
MKTILLSIGVGGKKDLVLLRQRTRQLASLLGFDDPDLTILAASVFDLACQRHRRRTTWNFWVESGCLHIAPDDSHRNLNGHIHKRLPTKPPFGNADILWLIRTICRLAPVNIFAEMQKVNQELLQALLTARSAQGKGIERWAA